MDSTVSPKMKTMEREKIRVCFLVCNTSREEAHAGVLGWGLERLTNKSIIHTDLHKPNNNLVSA
jgi:hypothetical protein